MSGWHVMRHQDPRYGNLSPRDANMMDAIEGEGLSFAATPGQVEDAQNLYLRWSATDWRKAEQVAYQALHAAAFTRPLIDFALDGFADQGFEVDAKATAGEVGAFISERVARTSFPQGKGHLNRALPPR
jgi:hypothetical protein